MQQPSLADIKIVKYAPPTCFFLLLPQTCNRLFPGGTNSLRPGAREKHQVMHVDFRKLVEDDFAPLAVVIVELLD